MLCRNTNAMCVTVSLKYAMKIEIFISTEATYIQNKTTVTPRIQLCEETSFYVPGASIDEPNILFPNILTILFHVWFSNFVLYKIVFYINIRNMGRDNGEPAQLDKLGDVREIMVHSVKRNVSYRCDRCFVQSQRRYILFHCRCC